MCDYKANRKQLLKPAFNNNISKTFTTVNFCILPRYTRQHRPVKVPVQNIALSYVKIVKSIKIFWRNKL